MYVFGVGPLVDSANINALASKKNNEQHVFKVKDMEDLENVFFQMIGRKMQGNVWGSCLQTGVADFPHPGRLPPPPSQCLLLLPVVLHFLISQSQNSEFTSQMWKLRPRQEVNTRLGLKMTNPQIAWS